MSISKNIPLEFKTNPEGDFVDDGQGEKRWVWRWTSTVSLNLRYVISAQPSKVGTEDAVDIQLEGGGSFRIRFDSHGFNILWRLALLGELDPEAKPS